MDIIQAVREKCPALHEMGIAIVRTADGNFNHMPAKDALKMKKVSDRRVAYDWLIGVKGDEVELMRGPNGKFYAASGWSSTPLDYKQSLLDVILNRPIPAIPIYFEELPDEEGYKLLSSLKVKNASISMD